MFRLLVTLVKSHQEVAVSPGEKNNSLKLWFWPCYFSATSFLVLPQSKIMCIHISVRHWKIKRSKSKLLILVVKDNIQKKLQKVTSPLPFLLSGTWSPAPEIPVLLHIATGKSPPHPFVHITFPPPLFHHSSCRSLFCLPQKYVKDSVTSFDWEY